MKKSEKAPMLCSVDFAFQRIGGKHKGRIVWCLKDGFRRYGEIKRAIVGITPKMLTQTLRELEEDELVVRQVYLEVPPRVEYRLTPSGEELLPFIALLKTWGEKRMAERGLEEVHGS